MIDFGPGAVVRIKKFRHLFSDNSSEYVEVAHPDKAMTGVALILGFERVDCTGHRINVNDVLRAFGWTLPTPIPIGTKVDYELLHETGGVQLLPATIIEHVEGWYKIEFRDKTTSIVRPSRVKSMEETE